MTKQATKLLILYPAEHYRSFDSLDSLLPAS